MYHLGFDRGSVPNAFFILKVSEKGRSFLTLETTHLQSIYLLFLITPHSEIKAVKCSRKLLKKLVSGH